jgi:hypothetical protein
LRHEGQIQLIVGTHVDDLIFAGTKLGIERIQQLQKTFPIKSWEFDNFVFCGRRVVQNPKSSEVTISMSDYLRTSAPLKSTTLFAAALGLWLGSLMLAVQT